jgi:hypothetical protein
MPGMRQTTRRVRQKRNALPYIVGIFSRLKGFVLKQVILALSLIFVLLFYRFDDDTAIGSMGLVKKILKSTV